MTLNKNKNLKLYYSIKEVATKFNINESTLRYWETTFPTLRPKTTVKNIRQYTESDIAQIRIIYNLVKIRGFKIASARKIISQNPLGADKQADAIEMLTSVHDQLLELKNKLDLLS
jgi:DNA-binding transcriptional MerR regulator